MPIDTLVLRFLTQNVGSVRRDIRSIGGDLGGLSTQFGRTATASLALGTVGVVGTRVLANLTKGALQAAGEVQRVETGYLTVLKDAQKVAELSRSVREFDVKTPFSYLESAHASQMLLASGFREGAAEGAGLMDTMYAIGNATVAAGKGTETFVRALAIMSKIKTSGTLTAIRVNQFAAAGINVKDILKEQLGLTDEQMINIGRLKLKADVVIPALNKGLMEKFKGGIEAGGKTYLGSLEILQGSRDKLLASMGKSIQGDATDFIKSLTGMTDSVNRFVSTHPRVTKMALALGFAGTSGLAIGAAIKIWRTAALTKKFLEMATNADARAEARKIPIAYSEAAAHNAAALAAGRHAAANQMLALPGPAGVAGVAGAAGQLGVMARMRAFMAAPLVSNAAMMRISASRFGAMPGWMTNGLLGASRGSGLLAGGLGAAAGYGVSDDYASLKDPNAAFKGIATGVGVAAASMFLPGGAVASAFAIGVRGLFNESVNRPMERQQEAEAADYDATSKRQKGMSGRALVKDNYALALEKEREAESIDTTLDFMGDDRARKKALLQEAARLRLLGNLGARAGAEENTAEAQNARWRRPIHDRWDAERARQREIARRSGTESTAGQIDTSPSGAQTSAYDRIQEEARQRAARAARVQAENEGRVMVQPEVTEHRNGAMTVQFAPIRIENRDASQQRRERRLRSTTMMPNLAR